MTKRDSKGDTPSPRKRKGGVVTFTKAQFEEVLPKDKTTGDKLWVSLGIIQGEEVYAVMVYPHVRIVIRSTVRTNGISAASGSDSIRLILEVLIPGAGTRADAWIPIDGGPDAWTTRQANWAILMLQKIRIMWSLGREIVHAPISGDRVFMASTAWNKNRVNAQRHDEPKFRWLDRAPSARVKYTQTGDLTKEFIAGCKHYAAMQQVEQDRAARAAQSTQDELFPED